MLDRGGTSFSFLLKEGWSENIRYMSWPDYHRGECSIIEVNVKRMKV